jgi:sugar lactone lactonase YvrE
MKVIFFRTLALVTMSAVGTWAQQAVNVPIGSPAAVAVDASGTVYFSSSFNRVFRVDPSGTLAVVAGTSVGGYSGDGGPAVSAELNGPQGLALDTGGNLYIADSNNNRVREVSLAGVITTMAGNGIQGYSGDNGPAASADLNAPDALAIDGADNLYIADIATNDLAVVRKVSAANGIITSIVDPGPYLPMQTSGIAVDQAGMIYVAVWTVNSVYEFSPSGALVTTFKGAFGPSNVALDRSGNLYIVDSCQIYSVSRSIGQLTVIAGKLRLFRRRWARSSGGNEPWRHCLRWRRQFVHRGFRQPAHSQGVRCHRHH